MLLYAQAVSEIVAVDEEVINQAKRIMEQSNIKQMDALHLSCAFFANAAVFLTKAQEIIPKKNMKSLMN